MPPLPALTGSQNSLEEATPRPRSPLSSCVELTTGTLTREDSKRWVQRGQVCVLDETQRKIHLGSEKSGKSGAEGRVSAADSGDSRGQ